MSKAVDLKSYWMPILRNLKEFKEIAKAEEPELIRILEAIEQTLANMFIETANEDGIKRFEKILGIIPEAGETLSTRRFKVLSMWSNTGVYTVNHLSEMLTSFCGEGNYEIIERYNEYIIEIVTHVAIKDAFELVDGLIRDALPCNMVLELSNIIEELCTHPLYIGGAVISSRIYTVSSNIMKATINLPLYCGATNSVRVGATITTAE